MFQNKSCHARSMTHLARNDWCFSPEFLAEASGADWHGYYALELVENAFGLLNQQPGVAGVR